MVVENALNEIILGPDHPLSMAVACIDASRGQIALVVDEAGRLQGTITDGDVRRAILSGATLETPARDVMNHKPQVARLGASESEVLARLKTQSLRQMPIVDESGLLVDIVYARDFASHTPADHQVVIMAGGLGTRLLPLTKNVPKPMVPIGDRPILEVIIERFREQGFQSFSLCVNHLAEVIENHFKDGSKFGVEISYVREPRRMGTGGALTLLEPRPARPMIVMNGDILSAVNFAQMLSFHYENGAMATMGVNRYQYQSPYGVVELANNHIASLTEKPIYSFFVNAGIYVIGPQVIDLIPKGRQFDLPSMFELLHQNSRVAFPIHEYWLDIGRHEDLSRANDEYEAAFGGQIVDPET